jgi:hypothetical protein
MRKPLEWVSIPNVEWQCNKCGGTYFHHFTLEGSRQHVLSWDSDEIHCSFDKCEVNHKCEGNNENP